MSTYAALFSGQGSQYPGMGKELYDEFAAVRAVYECAGDILGYDVAALSFEGEEQAMARTLVAQPLIFTLSAAAITALRERAPEFAPAAVAGHSLGEFAALWYAGAYSLEDGLRIIKARAEAMDSVTTPGVMYAVVGGEAAEVEAACAATEGLVLAVNYNQPSQTVISGEADAAAKAAAALEAAGKKVVKLAVSAAFHTPLMQSAADRFRAAIAGIPFQPAAIPFYSNLSGEAYTVADYPAYFAEHMVSPVRFVSQMNALAAAGVTACLEFGPGRTACTLAKKNVRAFTVANVEDLKSLEKALAVLA